MLTRMPVTHILLLAPPTEHSSHSHHDSVPSLSSRIRAPHPPPLTPSSAARSPSCPDALAVVRFTQVGRSRSRGENHVIQQVGLDDGIS